MRALVFHGPWDLGVEERPDPVARAGEVVLKVVATGICGSDVHGYTGENGRRFPGQVMGHETVARVQELGPEVAELAPGDLVTVHPVLACRTCPACLAGQDHRCPTKRVIGVAPEVSSAFADYLVVPAKNAVRLPESMPAEYGALVEPLSVGYHAMVRATPTADDRVLVVGGGPIGQAGALAARRLVRDVPVVVSEPSAPRRRVLETLGVATVDPSGTDLAAAAAAALGGPPTVVIDAVGSSRSVTDGLEAMDMGGRLVLVGMHEPRLELPAYAVSVAERDLIGSFCYTAEHFASTAEWVASAPPELDGLIDGRVGWNGAVEAFRTLANGENPASKVLVFPDGV